MRKSELNQQTRSKRTGSNTTLKQRRQKQQKIAFESYKRQNLAPKQNIILHNFQPATKESVRPLQSPKLIRMNINPLRNIKTRKSSNIPKRSKSKPRRQDLSIQDDYKENQDLNNNLTENYLKNTLSPKYQNSINDLKRKVKNDRKRRRKNSTKLKRYLTSYSGKKNKGYKRNKVSFKKHLKRSMRKQGTQKKKIKIVRNPQTKLPCSRAPQKPKKLISSNDNTIKQNPVKLELKRMSKIGGNAKRFGSNPNITLGLKKFKRCF